MEELVFEKKKKLVRGKLLLWALMFLLGGGALIGVSYFVLYSDFFKVSAFDIKEPKFTTKENLLAALNAEMIGRSKILSLLGPDNILFWELGKKPQTLAALPLLSQLSLNTDLIAKKVMVIAEEREFEGIWCSAEDCYVFDKEGIVFARAPNTEGFLILKIYDENNRPLVAGAPVFTKSNWRENVFKTLEVMENHGFTISRVNIKDFGLQEWEVKTTEGPVFQFSLNFVPQSLEKILENLNQKFEFDKVSYFDFRVENRIYYK